jgi:hypothetical protein
VGGFADFNGIYFPDGWSPFRSLDLPGFVVSGYFCSRSVLEFRSCHASSAEVDTLGRAPTSISSRIDVDQDRA